MAELHIEVKSRALPISTGLLRFWKAAEHFYYVLLIASRQCAPGADSPWRSWQTQGFHLAIKNAPPGVADADRVKLDTVPGVKCFSGSLFSMDSKTLADLGSILTSVAGVRKSMANADHQQLLAALLANVKINEILMEPLYRSLAQYEIPAEGRAAFRCLIEGDLAALADPEFQEINIKLS